MAEAMNLPASSITPRIVAGSACVNGSSLLRSSMSQSWVRTKAMSSIGGV